MSVLEYIETVNNTVLANTNNQLWLLGRKLMEIDEDFDVNNIKLFDSIDLLLNKL